MMSEDMAKIYLVGVVIFGAGGIVIGSEIKRLLGLLTVV